MQHWSVMLTCVFWLIPILKEHSVYSKDNTACSIVFVESCFYLIVKLQQTDQITSRALSTVCLDDNNIHIIIDIFIVTMYQKTMWKHCDDVLLSLVEKYQLNLQLLSAFTELYSFNSLFICPATTLMFWFALSTLIVIFRDKAVKSHCTPPAPANRQTQLETSWWTQWSI